MLRSRGLAAVLVAASFCLAPLAAWAIINPDFTPIHLTEQSDVVLLAKVKNKAIGDSAELELVEALKGKSPKDITIDFSKAPEKHVEMAKPILEGGAGQPVLLFSGEFADQEEEGVGFLHVRGQWLQLKNAGPGKWEFVGIASKMDSTWNGGTDMLLRCVKYITANEGNAFVPVMEGTKWRSTVKAGKLGGRATDILAVDLAGDGRLALYVASAAGDRLFVCNKDVFEDATDKVKLGAKSRASAWGDFDGNGRQDLASFDGKELTIWSQGADGAFAAAKTAAAVPADCAGVATVGLAGQPRPAIVLSGSAPVLLTPDGKGGFEAQALAKGDTADLGKPQAALVADFNNDALPDIIQPFEKNGLLYVAKKGGGFETPAVCGVYCTRGGGHATIGDFDGDGWPDIVVGGAEAYKIFDNLKNGKFEETETLSGESAYKAQPMASWVCVGDFNNDCLQDVVITYAAQPILLYFNRGFRSFGQGPKLEMAVNEVIEGITDGQQMGLFADLDHDGAQDLVLVAMNGDVWCLFNDLGAEDALAITARMSPKSPFPGPITVTAYQEKRLLGGWQVAVGAQPVFLGLRDAGSYTLKWQLPNGAPQSKDVKCENKPVAVILGE